jgi:hypothetical protein
MRKLFKAIKIGYEVMSAFLAVEGGGSYIVWPEFKGIRYKVTVEKS